MKVTLYRVVMIVAVLAVLGGEAAAQRKKPAPKTPAAPTVNPAAAEIKAGAERTSTELKKAARFLYLLGGIAQGIEDIDAQAKDGKTPKSVVDRNEQFKQTVIQGIKNLQSGLAELEVEYRTKAGLRPYAESVTGVTAIAGSAEDLALQGKFKDAGRTLLGVVEKLSDALVALP